MFKMPSNTPPAKDPRELWRHFSDTYFSLRVGLAALAFAFPFVLYFWGRLLHGLDLQPSMSAYFWAARGDGQCAAFPMRTLFVGFLFAIGVGLHLYKGLTTLENWLLNTAGICAALVAIFPERLKEGDLHAPALFAACPATRVWAENPVPPVHWIAAVLLFVMLAIVAWQCASKSLEYLPAGVDPARYRRLYRSLAIAMILFPIPGVALAWLLGKMTHWVFFVEAAGILTFGAYWAVKSRELSLSKLEEDPIQAVQQSTGHDAGGGAPPAQAGGGSMPRPAVAARSKLP